ncbi:preprotein translocase subunit YajC [Arthrobacter zhaoguopingii]|uniref:preprotein translocase subunit YajC n=1 Tax=Arthrobacter zhaoguopingii TaxID=2681491 RepID=UPI001FE3E00D|nr:preprotein translocase subunit YajC [Arthrobacter zhaoguopingii]
MFANVVASTATEAGDAAGSSFDIFNLILPLALAFLIFSMFRRQRKAKQQVTEMRSQMEPGTEVMTQFGLFGTIVSIDQENNKAVIELSPGNTATVHTQALSKVVRQEPAEDLADEPSVAAPDTIATTGAAGTGGSTAAETPEETVARLNRENNRNNDN